MALEDVPPTIRDRKQFADFVNALSRDWEEGGDKWENRDIGSFLEAMGAWLEGSMGYYRNFSLDVNPDEPSWRVFADALLAARVYE